MQAEKLDRQAYDGLSIFLSLPSHSDKHRPGCSRRRRRSPWSSEAPWQFRLTSDELPDEALSSAYRAIYYPYPDEFRFYPADTERLRALSEQTGGKFQPEIADIFADLNESASVPTQLWPFLAALALLLNLLDIALRRVPWLWQRLEARLAPKRQASSLKEGSAPTSDS